MSSYWCVSEEEARAVAATYRPQLSGVLPPELEPAVEALAEKIHDAWAEGRQEDGWTFGPKRDDWKQEHPDLVPSNCLSDGEKLYDEKTAETAMLGLLALGYKIIPPATPPAE